MVRHAGKAPSQRQLRVGEALRHALSHILQRGHFRDPVLSAAPEITVTEVRVSPDLKNATVFVVPLAGREGPQVATALNRAQGYLRTLLAEEVELRYLPRLDFELDRSFDQAERIDTLLNRPRVRADLNDAETDGETDGGDEAAGSDPGKGTGGDGA
jgi:ribosome-binding factor A